MAAKEILILVLFVCACAGTFACEDPEFEVDPISNVAEGSDAGADGAADSGAQSRSDMGTQSSADAGSGAG